MLIQLTIVRTVNILNQDNVRRELKMENKEIKKILVDGLKMFKKGYTQDLLVAVECAINELDSVTLSK